MNKLIVMNKVIVIQKKYGKDNVEWGEHYYRKGQKSLQLNINNEYKPKKGDRLYIYPGSTIPRFKLKSLCEKYNIAVSKTVEKSNVQIIDPDAIIRNVDYIYGINYKLYKEPFIKYLRNLPIHKYGDLIKCIENNTDPYIYMSCNAKWFFEAMHYPYKFVDCDDAEEGTKLIVNYEDIDYNHTFIETDSEELYLDLLSKEFVHQDYINKLLGDDSVIMDEELYEGFKSLLNSNDVQDQQVAMEGMANCNYDESAVYLLLLFYEFSSTLYDHTSRNHVNFKSLTKYFDMKSRYRFHMHIDDIVTKLKDKGLLSSKNMDRLMQEATRVVLDEGETNCFKVTKVVPSDEIQEIIEDTDAKLSPKIEEL